MKFFQELTILSDPEISPYVLWSKLYTQLHLALVEHAKATYGEDATHGDIGVSFPEYKCFEKTNSDNSTKAIAILGSKLRVFAKSKNALEQLNIREKCERLEDYLHIKSIKPVPDEHSYITVSRVRQVRNLDRVARRRAKRKNTSFDEAKSNIIKHHAATHNISIDEATKAYHHPQLTTYPYITMKSESSGHFFALEIRQAAADVAQDGRFNTYGMSSTTTLPHWKNSAG